MHFLIFVLIFTEQPPRLEGGDDRVGVALEQALVARLDRGQGVRRGEDLLHEEGDSIGFALRALRCVSSFANNSIGFALRALRSVSNFANYMFSKVWQIYAVRASAEQDH